MITRVRAHISFEVEVCLNVEHDEDEEPCDLTDDEREEVIDAARDGVDRRCARILDVHPEVP